jgi:hypothetical protein
MVAKCSDATDVNSSDRTSAKVNGNPVRLAMIQCVENALTRGGWSLSSGHLYPFNQVSESSSGTSHSDVIARARPASVIALQEREWLRSVRLPKHLLSQKNARFCSYQAYTLSFPLATDRPARTAHAPWRAQFDWTRLPAYALRQVCPRGDG